MAVRDKMYQLVHYVNAGSECGCAASRDVRNASADAHIAENDVDHLRPPRRQRLGRLHIPLKDGRKCRAVRDIEKAQGADRHMDLDRIEVAVKNAFLLTAGEYVPQLLDHAYIEA